MSTDRRTFLATAGAALVEILGCTAPGRLQIRRTYDVLIHGGTIFDGTGTAGIEGDIGLRAGRIAAVGRPLTGSGRSVIDARGLAVAPGFIDIHSHADGTLFDDPRAESVIRQGITTVVVGQDGSSRAPTDPDAETSAKTRLRRTLRADPEFHSLSEFLQTVHQLPSAVNVASMVGLGTVRATVMGDSSRAPTRSERQRMIALVQGALAQGACGASSGLEYTPGAFASSDELIALCRPLAALGLPYATHMRNEDDALLESIDEAIAVARGAACPLQISHLKTQGPRNWGKIGAALERIEGARREGLDVAFDRYPYIAYQTGLTNLFPVWSRDGGASAFLSRLDDASLAPRIRAEVLAKVDLIGGWDNVMISTVENGADRAAEGQRLAAYAASRTENPYDTATGLLRRSQGNVGMVGFAMSEENTARILAHPLGMVCSDGGAHATEGPARRGHPHPRALGSFPRVLGHYVRDRKVLTLAQAVHKMSGFPAARVKLADRGRIAAGFAGDVVVFDPTTVADRATFTEPFQYPVGIRAVIVNGAIALHDGQRSEMRTGRALRAGSSDLP